MNSEVTQDEKEGIRVLLSSYEIPTLIGTAIIEVSLLWNDIDYWQQEVEIVEKLQSPI